MNISVDTESSPRIITILAPTTFVTIQTVLNWIREWEHDIPNLEFERLCDATGKDALRSGKVSEIVLTLHNAKIAFEARVGPSFVECEITGGSLLAVDVTHNPISPIEPTAYVQVNYAEAVSGAAVTAEGVWTYDIESPYTATDLLRLMAAALAGKSSGGGTGTITFRDLQDTVDRLVANVDGSGNRTAVSKDPT
jgi:hypothetical protein